MIFPQFKISHCGYHAAPPSFTSILCGSHAARLSRSSHINLCPCPISTLFLSSPFPRGSSAHQGHVVVCILAWSVTMTGMLWPVIYSDNKHAPVDRKPHLWTCCKICTHVEKLILLLFFCLVVHLFIIAAHQRDPPRHRLRLIWKRCDLKGACLFSLAQLRDGRDANLTMKKAALSEQ